MVDKLKTAYSTSKRLPNPQYVADSVPVFLNIFPSPLPAACLGAESLNMDGHGEEV